MPTTILLVDDHPLFRKGLRLLLEEQEDFHIVGEAGDGREAMEQIRALSPDVVIMDISMPKYNGIDATRQILSEDASAKVVALSMHAGKRFVEDMLRAGAAGYILKKSVPEDLVNGVRVVVEGDIYLSPAITGIVVTDYKAMLASSSSPAKIEDASLILRTKLQRSALPQDLVARPDLVKRFDELRHRPLTLVSSAAGYGKSSLASLWLEAWDGSYAWLSLDDDENDLRQFVTYLLAAIGYAFPGTCETTRSLLQSPEVAPVSKLSRCLINDLVGIREPFILVLDDFQNIREKNVHDLIAAIMAHPPQNLHLMLLTRRDPPLLTSRLRARDLVNEVGTADLRFTLAETAAFLENALGYSVDEKSAETIQDTLEGWPAGMRLISHFLKDSGNLGRLLAGLKGGFAAIVDYLVTEVLSHQSSAMARWMTATAIPDFFCAPLCDAMQVPDTASGTDEMNGDEFIARLQKDKLFLIALDQENRWYRYHHLFRQLLHSRLDQYWRPDEIDALHSRSKAWLTENDITDHATNISPTPTLPISQSPPHPLTPSPTPLVSPSPSSSPKPLVEPLTNRELDVLDLLAQRMSNQEIADKLHISITTVKSHIHNIYGKLNVNKRREAVEKAQSLGILPGQ